MTRTRNMKLKGFTLIELIVVIAIIGVLSGILIPAITGFVREAKVNAAITDARTVKQAIEFSLVQNLAVTNEDVSGAFNKSLYLDQNKDPKKRQIETVGAFSQVSWVMYRNNKLADSASQKVDKTIAGALDNAFSEKWKTGVSCNAMKYNKPDYNCAQYLKDNKTNFGLIVVYDTMGTVRLMQLYRKGVLVTYVNGEYLANTNPNAHFVGEGTWDTIYKDCGMEAPEEVCQISLKNGQGSGNQKWWN
jgi:prepilin-type N-terminal cleavage/methylation domain-containing protein